MCLGWGTQQSDRVLPTVDRLSSPWVSADRKAADGEFVGSGYFFGPA